MNGNWQIGADTGGTFTDLIGVDPMGKEHRAKVLSSGCLRAQVVSVDQNVLRLSGLPPMASGTLNGFRIRRTEADAREFVMISHDNDKVTISSKSNESAECFSIGDLVELFTGEEAPVVGARVMTGTPANAPLPPIAMRLGTTRGTNALLERRGAKTLFLVTEGFADLLRIGDQRRPELFELNIRKPRPLYDSVIEVSERLAADGSILQALEPSETLRHAIRTARESGCETAAVALLHSYRNSIHEEGLAELLREEGFGTVSLSSALAPFIKLLPRAQTAVTNAYLGPVMESYLDDVQASLAGGQLHLMTSAGGLVGRAQFHPKDSLLSGPAGGVVGAAAIGKQAGCPKVIAFDMGGTSTDVSRFDGSFSYQQVQRVGDSEIVAPALSIETVAAGGGSICGYDGKSLFVGPQSAGANPGPACYGAGGPLTLTDVNLLAGRLNPEAFGIPVFPDAAQHRLEEIMQATAMQRDALLDGFLGIANERMADAIRTISLREGYDPADYALVAFGGAGGLHACPVAEHLGIKTVLFAKDAGLLSAYGLRRACIERIVERQVLLTLEEAYMQLGSWLSELAAEGRVALQVDGIAMDDCVVRKQVVFLRLLGQESTLEVEVSDGSDLTKDFAERYKQVFGYWQEGAAIEVVKLQVVVSSHAGVDPRESFTESENDMIHGPQVMADATATLVIDKGWCAMRGHGGTLKLEHVVYSKTDTKAHDELVQRELFTNRFRRVVEEMGTQLQRTAVSTNVKERYDYSCALLDASGGLIANAPHIPVHLGALGMCVRRVAEVLPMDPGDVVITNHPAYGGSHLPDVTVITPVFTEGKELLGYVASRAHHAEIGGKRPGSMPIDATTLAEEGVVITPQYLMRAEDSNFDQLEMLLRESAYPSRDIANNLADIRAQVAANRRGADTLRVMANDYGMAVVSAQMCELKAFSAQAMRKVLHAMPKQPRTATQRLDDGSEIVVEIHDNASGKLVINFSGTADVHPGNLNATPAIIQSAVVYVLRLLVSEDIPLNDGLLEDVEIVLPEGMLNPVFPDDPTQAPAVMGGNVEVSQRVVDALLLALEVAAGSQGTMNNLVFGNDKRSYYETICGGAGAGDGFAGASAVHTHMTNTAITDPEILEWRYPVRLWRFEINAGTGGLGQYMGGDGIVRELEFLAPLSVSLLTQHRREGPVGLSGGGSGKPGRQTLRHADGRSQQLDSADQFEAAVSDRLTIETPGGGGYGAAK